MSRHLVTVNAGPSSIKFSLFVAKCEELQPPALGFTGIQRDLMAPFRP